MQISVGLVLRDGNMEEPTQQECEDEEDDDDEDVCVCVQLFKDFLWECYDFLY